MTDFDLPTIAGFAGLRSRPPCTKCDETEPAVSFWKPTDTTCSLCQDQQQDEARDALDDPSRCL